MKIINCTPHSINVQPEDGSTILVIPASGSVIRIDTEPRAVFHTTPEGVPVALSDKMKEVYIENEAGERSPLSTSVEGEYYLVSAIVGSLLKNERTDLLIGASSPADKPHRHATKGFITAVRRLKQP